MHLKALVFLLKLFLLMTFQLCDSTFVSKYSRVETNKDELNSDYWISLGKSSLRQAINQPIYNNKAKYVILFLGDGLSVATLTSARILKGQLQNKTGEESSLVFENFPHVSLIKTYNIDSQIPDSAGTATAFLSGVKTNIGVLGVNAHIRDTEKNCSFVEQNKVTSILKWAEEAGKSSGIVTTTRLTHATPAAGYSHIPDRDFEMEVPATMIGNCKDIARQLVEDEPGVGFKVILGGGRRKFMPINEIDPNGVNVGERKDDRNLFDDWLAMRNASGLNGSQYAFVNSTARLEAVDYDRVEYLFGAFSYDHMQYEAERDTTPNGQPSIAMMTESAIKILSQNANGFVLLVEGGRIDHAHHDNYGTLSLTDTIAFDEAIAVAMKMLPEKETLIVVTADHAHTLTMNGYPERGNPILGVSGDKDGSGVPFTTLLYGNGPGYEYPRSDPTIVDIGNLRYRQYSGVRMGSATHSGEDVALHSRGPMSHLFQGTQEQSYVAHVMAFAACLGEYTNEKHCASASSRLTFSNNYLFYFVTLVITFRYFSSSRKLM